MKLHWTQALWGKELGSIEQCNAMEKKPHGLSIAWSRMDLERSMENDLFAPDQLMHFDSQDFVLLYYFILGLSK